jgi:hypothetical protein
MMARDWRFAAALLLLTAGFLAPMASNSVEAAWGERRARDPAREESAGRTERGKADQDVFEQRRLERKGGEAAKKRSDDVFEQRRRERDSTEAVERTAAERVSSRADHDIHTGECFNWTAMEKAAPGGKRSPREALDAWRSGGSDGAEARRLAPELGRRQGEDVLRYMEGEIDSGRAKAHDLDRNAGPVERQTMRVWEYDDGTVVRYKPKGDAYRPEPTHSVEVKIDRTIPDSEARQDGIAFKVDANGRAVPRGPQHVLLPDGLSSRDRDLYVERVMDAGHMGERRE